MAKHVLKDASVEIDGTDLSDHFSQVTVETVDDEVPVTAMGATSKENIKGLGDATITGEVYQDYAAGEIDATLWPLYQSDTPFSVRVKPTSADASDTNPVYFMDALLFNYSPIAGSVGEANTTSVTFRNATQDGLRRGTDENSS